MANPLAEGLGLRRKPDPCALVVFGASGDLTKRKLFPALYALAYRGLLPDRFAVVGVARTEQPTRQFLTGMRAAVKQYARDPFRSDVFESLAEGVRYVATEFDDDSGEDRVGEALEDCDRTRGTAGNRLHYLAVPPQAFPTVVREIGERRERLEDVGAERVARVLLDRRAHPGQELPRRLLRAGDADDREPVGQEAAVRERVQRREQLALRQVARRAEDDHGARVRLAPEPQACRERVRHATWS